MSVESPKPNGSGAASSPPPSGTERKSRLRRTLLTAGLFALIAMIYVPTPGHPAPRHRFVPADERFVHPGYRFIFSGEDTSIAFFQLLVNVAFAALLGAILANIRWRRQRRPRIEKPRQDSGQRLAGMLTASLAAVAILALIYVLAVTLGEGTRVENKVTEREQHPVRKAKRADIFDKIAAKREEPRQPPVQAPQMSGQSTPAPSPSP